MSIRATNFVRGLRGLSPTEKAVAFVLADHDDHKGGGTFPSMLTVAEEGGLHERSSTSRITKRLVDRRIIHTDNPSKGRKPTVYRFNFELANRAPGDTVENRQTVFPQSQLETSNRVPATSPTVFLDGPNRVPQDTGRVEGVDREGDGRLLQFSSSLDSEQQEPVPTPSDKSSAGTNGGQRAHLEAGIYRKTIDAAYFDAMKAGMKPDQCIREAIYAGALSLVSNRSVQLRGLDRKDLSRNAWKLIRDGVAALHGVKNFDLRRKQVVRVITRCLTSAALDFLERASAETNAAAHQ